MAAPTMTVPHEQLAEQIGRLLVNGGTLGSVYDYTERDYEVLYALGHSLYSQARYADATKVFGFLVMHNHLERRFVNAYASALHMTRNYKDAIQFYTYASVMDMTDPTPTFHTCECMMALGQLAEARQGLEIVIRQCDRPEQAPLKERASTLLGALGTYQVAADQAAGSAS